MDELPLLALFTTLRESGIPLGIRDYEAALKALQAGYGLSDPAATVAEHREALRRLCRTLWVRTADEQRLLDYHLEQLLRAESKSAPSPSPLTARFSRFRAQWRSPRIRLIALLALASLLLVGTGTYLWRQQHPPQIDRPWPPESTPSPPANEPPPAPTAGAAPPAGPAASATTAPTQRPTPVPPSAQPSAQPAMPVPFHWMIWSIPVAVSAGIGGWWLVSAWLQRRSRPTQASDPRSDSSRHLTSELFRETQDEIQVAQALLQVSHVPDRARDRFLRGDYLPVTQRQMKQSWRHLRRMIREGLPTELDVAATVRQIAQDGILLHPVLVPPRINRTELILLIDQGGSMVPFQALAQRLVATAQRGGRLGRTGVYYFHNCPMDYLYHDPFDQQWDLVADRLAQFRRDRTVVLIFSDAGAARGGLHWQRVGWTLAFLRRLRRRVRYVAWLNPMPQERWAGTTAAEIAHHVPMLEGTRQGLDRAIDVLRGKHTSGKHPSGLDKIELSPRNLS